MLLGALTASTLGNMLARKPKISGRGLIRTGEELLELEKEPPEQVKVFNSVSFFI